MAPHGNCVPLQGTCQPAHQQVGAPRTLPRCLTKTCRLEYCLEISYYLRYIVFAILFLGYLGTIALSALLSSLFSTFLS